MLHCGISFSLFLHHFKKLKHHSVAKKYGYLAIFNTKAHLNKLTDMLLLLKNFEFAQFRGGSQYRELQLHKAWQVIHSAIIAT